MLMLCCEYRLTHPRHDDIPQREWKDLGRLIEEDRRLRDALKRRIQDTAAAAQQQQKQQPKVGAQPASLLSPHALPASPSGKGPLASGKDAVPQQQQQRVASPSPASPAPSGLLKVARWIAPYPNQLKPNS